MEEMSAEDVGKQAEVVGGEPLSDLELLMEIARLKRSVASFGGAVLLTAYRAEAEERGLKEV